MQTKMLNRLHFLYTSQQARRAVRIRRQAALELRVSQQGSVSAKASSVSRNRSAIEVGVRCQAWLIRHIKNRCRENVVTPRRTRVIPSRRTRFHECSAGELAITADTDRQAHGHSEIECCLIPQH